MIAHSNLIMSNNLIEIYISYRTRINIICFFKPRIGCINEAEKLNDYIKKWMELKFIFNKIFKK